MFVLWGLAAYVLLNLTGCVSVNLAGGRTIMVTQVMSDGNDLDSGLEAETSLKDSVKDLLKMPETGITVPDIPEAVQPEIVPPTPLPKPPAPPLPLPEPNPGPGPADSVMVDGEWIPAPSDPTHPLGRTVPGWKEREQGLWKAESETTKNLVILLPMSLRPSRVIIYAATPDHKSVRKLDERVASQATRTGANGNRTHWRFPKSGRGYQLLGHDTKLKVYVPGGTIWYDVKSPATRSLLRVSKHQDK